MSQSHAPPPAVPAPSPPEGYPPPPATPRQNGLAVASLVLGIVSLACSQCITALPGVILGHIALRQIRDSGGAETGEGMAIGGLVCGYISIGIAVLVALVWVLFVLLGLGAAAVSA
ncbi:MAG: DUF4190 domain-containing protein [Phycisphaerae bacterium]